MKNIEIEFRSKISKEKYDWLHEFLGKNAKDLGEDNKDTKFYILPDMLFKVVDEKSKDKAKVVLKTSRIGDGSDFDEIEITIIPEEFEKAIELFDHLNLPGKAMQAWQERHNYLYKGVELAVKYSEYWEHHVELEIVVNDMSQKATAEEKIRDVAKELDIELMTDEEIKAFTQTVESKL